MTSYVLNEKTLHLRLLWTPALPFSSLLDPLIQLRNNFTARLWYGYRYSTITQTNHTYFQFLYDVSPSRLTVTTWQNAFIPNYHQQRNSTASNSRDGKSRGQCITPVAHLLILQVGLRLLSYSNHHKRTAQWIRWSRIFSNKKKV